MDDDNPERVEKERRNDLFQCRELGALLRLFSSLGITVALGIVGFFLLGLWVDREAAEMGYRTRGGFRIAFLLLGLGLSIYWAYMRIARHLKQFDADGEED